MVIEIRVLFHLLNETEMCGNIRISTVVCGSNNARTVLHIGTEFKNFIYLRKIAFFERRTFFAQRTTIDVEKKHSKKKKRRRKTEEQLCKRVGIFEEEHLESVWTSIMVDRGQFSLLNGLSFK